ILKWSISVPFPDSEQGAVHAARAITPGRRGVVDRFIKIVVSMKLDQLTGDSGMHSEAVDDPRNGSWNHGSRIIYTVSHCIADADLNRNLVLFHQFHQFNTEGDHKSINV